MSNKISLASIFIWIGFVSAISFMEAWLKFRAPGITLPLGLGIGRLVFNALNKVEWVLMLSVLISLFPFKVIKAKGKIALIILLAILILQTIWLLPALDLRAEQHINNTIVSKSNLHFYYVIAELVKVIVLFFTGTILFYRLKLKN